MESGQNKINTINKFLLKLASEKLNTNYFILNQSSPQKKHYQYCSIIR